MAKFHFEVTKKDSLSRARTGVIFTEHGEIKTPAFVPVGTQATVKSLDNSELTKLKVQIFFVNTYHMVLRPGLEVIEKMGGLHRFIGLNIPLITDSTGFQIFSLGNSKRLKIIGNEKEPKLVKINEDGVIFRSHLDGSEHSFTPEKSIAAQGILGADIAISFDECTFYPASHDYSKAAMERTHRWGLRGLVAAQNKLKDYQALYGVVQGGIYEDLRVQSAKYISSLDFPGIAIGGVSVGESKKEMKSVLKWVIPNLPDEKPRHLLGVGEIDDIFDLVAAGVDSFDCVMPTRLGRMGRTLVQNSKFKVQSWTIDITKAEYADDKRPIDEQCECDVCKNYSRAYLNHLFRAKEPLAYKLASFHNVYFINNLAGEIRKSIEEGKFSEFRKSYL